jgi:hypothetical protein
MSDERQASEVDFSVDTEGLYREESITDMKIGAIRRFLPIKLDGTPDDTRPTRFTGHTQVMSPQGPMPIHSQLDVETLEAAVKAFPAAMESSLKEMIERIQQMQQEEAARESGPQIITPGM